MALISCSACGERISPQAAACPKCGHPVAKSSRTGCWLIVVLLFAVVLTIAFCSAGGGGGARNYSATNISDLCPQSAEAAHYIAAASTSSDDVTRVTSEAIADRKYPALDDKQMGLIGSVVALSRERETPDEISAKIRASCEGAVKP